MASRARSMIVARKIKKHHPWGRDFSMSSSILTQNYRQDGPKSARNRPVGPSAAPSSAGRGARRSPRLGRATQTRRESFPCLVSAAKPPQIGPKVGFASSAAEAALLRL